MTDLAPYPSIERVDPGADPGLEDVRAVLDSAARRLARAGIEQWPVSFLEDGGRRMIALAHRAQRGEVFLVRWLGKPAATITLSHCPDPDFVSGWPGIGEDRALYISRLAVADHARRSPTRWGGWLLRAFAPDQALSQGDRYLRLDCSRTNRRLHRYYLEHGFVQVGDVEVPGRKSGALFQLDLTVASPPLVPLRR